MRCLLRKCAPLPPPSHANSFPTSLSPLLFGNSLLATSLSLMVHPVWLTHPDHFFPLDSAAIADASSSVCCSSPSCVRGQLLCAWDMSGGAAAAQGRLLLLLLMLPLGTTLARAVAHLVSVHATHTAGVLAAPQGARV